MISRDTYVLAWPKCAESYTVGPQVYHAKPFGVDNLRSSAAAGGADLDFNSKS